MSILQIYLTKLMTVVHTGNFLHKQRVLKRYQKSEQLRGKMEHWQHKMLRKQRFKISILQQQLANEMNL